VRVGIIGGSIAGCATAALLHRAGHDVLVFERSESDLVSRGAGILAVTAAWQDMMAHGLIDETLPACRADRSRFVTRAAGTGQQRWLGDVQLSATLLNWAHLYRHLRRRVPDELYHSDAAVERIETTPHGTTLHLPAGSLDFDLVVCADGYRSLGRRLIDPGPGPGERLLMWGYYLQVRQSALASVLVDDQERQQSGSVPFGKVHPEVRAALESRLAGLLPSSLFELVRQSGNSSIQAIYSYAARSYARDRVCLAGDAGTVLPPFAGSGVLRAIADATSLTEALAGAPATDDALRRWSEAQLQAAAQVIPAAEHIERAYVFGMPDFAAMPAAAANDWMSAAYSGFALTLPSV
jgi:2-polyprenyl-6-methoxyphenol hydroxylase-like FAD-dependent oxidoreductase